MCHALMESTPQYIFLKIGKLGRRVTKNTALFESPVMHEGASDMPVEEL